MELNQPSKGNSDPNEAVPRSNFTSESEMTSNIFIQSESESFLIPGLPDKLVAAWVETANTSHAKEFIFNQLVEILQRNSYENDEGSIECIKSKLESELRTLVVRWNELSTVLGKAEKLTDRLSSQQEDNIDSRFASPDILQLRSVSGKDFPQPTSKLGWRNLIDQNEKLFGLPEDKAIFWTGWNGGQDEKICCLAKANKYAKLKGKKTLEMTPGGLWLSKYYNWFTPSTHYSEAEAKAVWSYASEKYLYQATGHVIAFIVPENHPNFGDSIYNTIEHPFLMHNDAIFLSENVLRQDKDCKFLTELQKEELNKDETAAVINGVLTWLEKAKKAWSRIATAKDFDDIDNRASFLGNPDLNLRGRTSESEKQQNALSQLNRTILDDYILKATGVVQSWEPIYAAIRALHHFYTLKNKKFIQDAKTNVLNARAAILRTKQLSVVEGWREHCEWIKEAIQTVNYYIFKAIKVCDDPNGARDWKIACFKRDRDVSIDDVFLPYPNLEKLESMTEMPVESSKDSKSKDVTITVEEVENIGISCNYIFPLIPDEFAEKIGELYLYERKGKSILDQTQKTEQDIVRLNAREEADKLSQELVVLSDWINKCEEEGLQQIKKKKSPQINDLLTKSSKGFRHFWKNTRFLRSKTSDAIALNDEIVFDDEFFTTNSSRGGSSRNNSYNSFSVFKEATRELRLTIDEPESFSLERLSFNFDHVLDLQEKICLLNKDVEVTLNMFEMAEKKWIELVSIAENENGSAKILAKDDRGVMLTWLRRDRRDLHGRKHANPGKKFSSLTSDEAFSLERLRWNARRVADQFARDPLKSNGALEGALKKWSDLADSHESVAILQREDNDAVKRAKRDLKQADRAVNLVYNEIIQQVNKEENEKQEEETNSEPLKLRQAKINQEIGAYKVFLIRKKEIDLEKCFKGIKTANLEAIIKYRRITVKDALMAARNHTLGAEAAWRFRVDQSLEAQKAAHPISLSKMIAISEVDAEAFETFKREEERFAFIEAVFREEEMAKIANFRAQREDIFASYLKGDQQRWNNLDLLQKISFNVQTEKENQKHALFTDKKIDQAGKNLQLIRRQAVKKRRFSVHQKKKAAEKLEITMLERAELELEYWKIEQTKRKELQRLGRMLPQEKKAEAIGDEADSLFKQTASIFPDQGAVFETAWNRVIAKTEEVGKLWENIVNIYFLNLSSASIGTAYNIIKNISLPYAVYSRERWNVEVLLRKAQRISLLADFTLKKAQTVPHDYAQVFETTWRDALNDTSEAKNLWEESLQLQRSGQEYVPSEFQQKWIDLLQHIEQLHEHWKAEISWRNAQKADCIATALKLKATATSHLNKTLFKENHNNALQAALAAEAAWQQVIEAEENGKAVVATKYHEEWNNNICQAKIARAVWRKQIGRSSSQCIIH